MRLVFSRPGAGTLALLAPLAFLLASCGDGRKACFPVTGTVTVDGKPAENCFVKLYSASQGDLAEGPNRVLPLGMTDGTGKFSLSTFGSDDGAPAGDYTAVFTWKEASGLLKNQFDGPDRLKGKYETPEKSGIKVKIEGKAQTLPPFSLTTK